ncbi:MAG: helix-turn-helix transcriptional regulator [Gammaproteobacteria bacterium]|nr:helix-turn-helix transcriptional regulator [Gammaproteobacteria bacterium]
MAANSGRVKKIDLGNAIWVALLSRCIESIGSSQFTDNLLNALKSITDFDYMVSFAYHQKEKPVCLYHCFSPAERTVFVDDYLKGPYLLDPFFKACSRMVDAGLYRLRDIAPDRFLQSEYYRSYYERTGLTEEVCYTFYPQSDVAVVISLMRSGDSQRFSAREFRLLESVSPIVCSLSQQHWQALSSELENKPSEQNAQDNHSMIEDTVAELFSPRITPRETQVVAQVLEGHSSDSIAKGLGISVGTVRIHRRNIYAKLNISSQEELFAMLFQKIRTVRDT